MLLRLSKIAMTTTTNDEIEIDYFGRSIWIIRVHDVFDVFDVLEKSWEGHRRRMQMLLVMKQQMQAKA